MTVKPDTKPADADEAGEPSTPFGNPISRIQAVTKDANATLLMLRILYWANRPSGGKHDLGGSMKKEDRWHYRAVAGWGVEAGLNFDQAKRALSLLAGADMIEKRTVPKTIGGIRGRIMEVRPTIRAQMIFKGVGADSPSPSGQICPDHQSKNALTIGADSPLSIYSHENHLENHQELHPISASSSTDALAGEPGKKGIQLKPGEKGIESLKDLESYKPDKLESKDAEANVTGFTLSYLTYAAGKESKYVPKLKPTAKQVGQMKPVYDMVPPGARLEFIKWAVDHWHRIAKGLKGDGQTPKSASEAVTTPGKGGALSVGFLAQHRAYFVQDYLNEKAYHMKKAAEAEAKAAAKAAEAQAAVQPSELPPPKPVKLSPFEKMKLAKLSHFEKMKLAAEAEAEAPKPVEPAPLTAKQKFMAKGLAKETATTE